MYKKKVIFRKTGFKTLLTISAFVFQSSFLIAQQPTFALLAGSGTNWDPYQIANALDLQNFTYAAVGDPSGDSTRGKYFKLMNDIDMTGLHWIQIGLNGIFSGNFDGNGKVIRNFTFTSNAAGLFGTIAGASIVNLGLENCNVAGTMSTGGLVSFVYDNSYISNCYVTGSIKGQTHTGGLIGVAHCTHISNCYFSGNIEVTNQGSYGVGGLVGGFRGVCGGDGSYYHSIISNCYVTGKVSAVSAYLKYDVGGVVGNLVDGIVRDCVVALDSLTSNTNTLINRIIGYEYFGIPSSFVKIGAILQNNYALNTMVVQNSNGNIPIVSNLNTECGMDIPMDSLKSFAFYNRAANWYQMPWDIQNPLGIWKICDGQDLPFLRYQGIICSYDIIATAGAGGTISPIGTINVDDTVSQVFIFTPNICYEIDSLWVDSVYFPDSIAAGSYTFNNITTNHTIEVNFKRLPPDTVTISDTICYGTNYTQNNFNITNAIADSVYFNNDFSANSCDSVTRLELTVNPLIHKQISDSICDSDFYDFHGDSLTASGIYYDTLPAISGCDSIIELTLTVHSIDTMHISIDICEGDSYDFFGRQLTEEGIYYETLQTVHGCDSVIELTLRVEGVGIVTITNHELRIYPNPTNGKLTIRYEESEMSSEIEVFDVVGRKLLSYTPLSSHSSPLIEIDISHLSAGLYFLKVDGKTVKVVKQ